jgi:uncharacterized protein (TIGR00369 family)
MELCTFFPLALNFDSNFSGKPQEERMERSTDAQKGARKKARVFDLATMERVPVADLIGFRVTEAKDGRAIATLEASEKHANPMGTLHGGILCDVADAAMGMAFASTLGEEETFTTLELKINFFRPVWNAKLTAEAQVIHRGKTLGYVECEVRDENNKLIAKTSSTCLALNATKGAGR